MVWSVGDVVSRQRPDGSWIEFSVDGVRLGGEGETDIIDISDEDNTFVVPAPVLDSFCPEVARTHRKHIQDLGTQLGTSLSNTDVLLTKCEEMQKQAAELSKRISDREAEYAALYELSVSRRDQIEDQDKCIARLNHTINVKEAMIDILAKNVSVCRIVVSCTISAWLLREVLGMIF